MPEERTNSQIEGILNSVKHMLGPEVDFEEFDSDIIIAINMAFSILYDQGLEKDGSPIMISGPDERWDEFITDPSILAKVKEYIFMKAKLAFDPPSNSFLAENYKMQIAELEWRIYTLVNDYLPEVVC